MNAVLLYCYLLWCDRPDWLKHHWRRLVFLGGITALLGACFACSPYAANEPRVGTPPVIQVPSSDIITEFPSLPWYPRWWANVEQCSGYKGDMSGIKWFVANKPLLAFKDIPGLFLGMYFRDENKIILGLLEPGDSVVVHHEMLHALRSQNGKGADGGSHGAEDFVKKCGAVVGPVYGSH